MSNVYLRSLFLAWVSWVTNGSGSASSLKRISVSVICALPRSRASRPLRVERVKGRQLLEAVETPVSVTARASRSAAMSMADGAQVDRRLSGFAVLRRARAVKGRDERESHPGEQIKLRRPYPARTARERRQRGDDFLPCFGSAHSPIQSSTAARSCGGNEAHGDKGFDLGEIVLVQLRRALRDEHDGANK
jgi:hypothetical protein